MEHFVTHAVEQYGYLGIFLLMALGSACIPIPSEVVMLFGGAFGNPVVGGSGHLDLPLVIIAGTLGTLVGSWFAYWIGRVGGRPLAERWGRFVFVRPHDIDRAETWFARYGEAAVFLSRLLPVVRAFISLPAGIAEMPLGTFTLYTFLGSVIWTLALGAAGYALGTQWTTVRNYLLPITIVMAVVLVAAVVWWLVARGPHRRPEPPDGSREPREPESGPATIANSTTSE